MVFGCQSEPLYCSSKASFYPINSVDIPNYLQPRKQSSLLEKMKFFFQKDCCIWTVDKGMVTLIRSDVTFSLEKNGEGNCTTKAGVIFSRMVYLHTIQRHLNEEILSEKEVRQIASLPLGIRIHKRNGIGGMSNVFYKYVLSCTSDAPPLAQEFVDAFSQKYRASALSYTLANPQIPPICSKGILCSTQHIMKIATTLLHNGIQPDILRPVASFSERLPFPGKYFIPYRFFFVVSKWKWIEKQIPTQIKPKQQPLVMLYENQMADSEECPQLSSTLQYFQRADPRVSTRIFCSFFRNYYSRKAVRASQGEQVPPGPP